MMEINLNQKQKEAVKYGNGPLLIVAGAGSGKTRTLTSRLINLLQKGISPENIIAITFTNKAADEMRSRISNQQPTTNNQQLFIGTFHSLGARILKNEARLAGRNRNFSIFDEDDSKSLVKRILKNRNLSEKERAQLSAAKLRREFSKIKNELIADRAINEEISDFYKEYEAELLKNNAFDFDDLLEKAARVFQKNPEVLEKYQNKFKYILVDEYQDTNAVQYLFIKLLAQKHRNISVVGDDQQAIFGFRGSDYRNFLNFENDWPEAKTILLEENYRSNANIIKAASAMIKNNKFQKPKELWTSNPDGELIKVNECENEDQEADWVMNQVQKFDNDNLQIIGILYRTNAQSRAIETALIEREIPYRIFGGIRFYERKEIKDIIAALRYGFNPDDSVSLTRLEKTFLKKQFLELKKELPPKAKVFSPMELTGFFIRLTDYFKYLKNNYQNYQERIENVNELVNFAEGFKNLGEFLEKISLLQDIDVLENKKSREKINLMTIHSAKGLEFDAVMVIGCNEGLLPHQMSYYNEAEIEEERRLMYVAMTRAKKELYLSFYHLPSRFLYELPPELVEFKGNRALDDEERYIEI